MSKPVLSFLGGREGAVEVSGLDPETAANVEQLAEPGMPCPQTLTVYTGEELPPEPRPPVLGSCALLGDTLRFLPRFPWQPGQPYVARFSGFEGSLEEVLTFEIPVARGTERAVVSAMYPSATEVPANLLKLYLHFSVAMEMGGAVDHLRVEDVDGKEVTGVFVAPHHELWDPSRRRLTVFFDPGRIKRGLQPHVEQGTPLESGRTYRVVVDAAWRDATGHPMAAPFEKYYHVHDADRSSPQPADWLLRTPSTASSAVEISFPEPLDHALLGRLLQVFDGAGQAVTGEVQVDRGETRWRFTPASPWRVGGYEVRVGPALEDLAGNSPGRVFDAEILPGAEVGDGEASKTVTLPFVIERSGETSTGEVGAL